MAVSAGAAARKDGHRFVTHAFADLVWRAASFFAERDRTRLFAFFRRTDIFLNETRRSDRSTLSRYRIERAGSCPFLTAPSFFLTDLPRGLTDSTQQRSCPEGGG